MTAKETDYWSKRINRIFDARERDIQTRKIYREAYTRMLSEVEEIYKAAEGREFTRTELYRFAKFLSFRRKAKSISGDIGRQLNKNMERTLMQAYKGAGLAAKDALGKPSEWTVVNKKMAEACVERKWAGSHFSNRIWTNRDLLARTVENGVRDCILTGKSYTKLMHEINSRWGVSRRRTECLVRTELAHTLNAAQIETYKSEGVKYLDFDCEPTACGECLDIAAGNPHRIDKLPCVIRHPNCRCTWLPVEDDDPRLADGKKQLQSSDNHDIMDIKNDKTVVDGVKTIGKISIGIYQCVTKDIKTDEVIITDERVRHIKERHPNDYEQYFEYAKEILAEPDYILEANKPNTALILKEFINGNEQFKTILRLVTSADNEEYKNSIITFMKINKKEWQRLIRNKKILYKSE